MKKINETWPQRCQSGAAILFFLCILIGIIAAISNPVFRDFIHYGSRYSDYTGYEAWGSFGGTLGGWIGSGTVLFFVIYSVGYIAERLDRIVVLLKNDSNNGKIVSAELPEL